MRLLVDAGADVHARDDKGLTPLHCAQGGPNEVTEALIAVGADVDARDSAGRTPLHESVERNPTHGQPWTVPLLLKAGANVALADNSGRTALHIAARMGG